MSDSKMLENWQVFKEEADYLFQNICGHLEEYSSYSKRMTQGQKMVILVWALCAEVANGGISQFFWNGSGDDSEDTREALRLIGATKQIEAFDTIERVVFKGSIPGDSGDRMKFLLEFEGDMDRHTEEECEKREERAEAFYDKFDEDFGWCEELEDLAGRFIRENAIEFPHTKKSG